MCAKNPDSPTKLTEFAPLSSEVRQSGGFFSKFFRRSATDSSQQSQPYAEQQSSTEDLQSANIKDEPEEEEEEGETEDNVSDVIDSASSPQPHRRTLSSVLKRLSNILDTRGQTPQIYKDSDFKQFWMPDRHCKECYECGDRFNTFRRRHHCRICGQIFCSRCCNQEVPGRIMGYTGFLRVCTYCCRVVLSYAQSREGSSDFEAFGEDLRRQMMTVAGEIEPGSSLQQEQTTWTPRKGSKLHMSTIFDEESRTGNRSSSDATKSSQKETDPFDVNPITDLETLQTMHQERISLLKDSKQLKEISQCLIHPDEGLELQSHRHRLRTYPGCLVGSEIVDWLMMKGKASSREQAVVIGQALLDGGWLECVSANQQLFSDLYSLYRPHLNATEEKISTDDFEQSIPASDDPEDDSAPSWFKAIEQKQSQDEESLRSISELNKIPSTVSVPENLNTSSKSVFFVETPHDTLQHVKPVPRYQSLSAKSLNEKESGGEGWKKLGREVYRSESGSEPYLDASTGNCFQTDESTEDWEIVDKPKANQEAIAENRPTEFNVPSLKDSSRAMTSSPYNLHQQDSIGASFSIEFIKGTSPSEEVQKVELATPGGWQEKDLMREDNIDRIAYDRLKACHRDHMISLVRQLLRADCLSLKWTETIVNISQHVAGQVKPDVKLNGDDMDIRQYVMIKKIPGGLKSHSSIISGVVCTKVIAHKHMRHSIANPKILLLRGPIEYQRVENKFSSLEPQILQEHEFLKNCVNRIVALKPDILLVEKTVSRLAQDFILHAGITLILNVKPSVMERVARFTQADIVTSIDGLVSKTTMGFCHSFSTQMYLLPEGRQKSLLYFEGCAQHLGCSITLRGGSTRELSKVKRILHFTIYVAYHSRLEVAFLMDEFAMPPPAHWENTFELLNSEDQKRSAEKTNNGSLSDENEKNTKHHTAESCDKNNKNIPSKKLEKGSIEAGIIESDSRSQHLDIPSVEKSRSGSASRSSRSPSRSRGSTHVVDVPTTEVLDQSDPLQNYQISKDESIFQKESSSMLTEVKLTGEYFKKALNDTILSISPYIKYDIPYLETEIGSKCELRKYFVKEIYWSAQFRVDDQAKKPCDDVKDESKIRHQQETVATKYHPFVTHKITTPVRDPKTQALIADFRARGGHIEALLSGKHKHSERLSVERDSSPFVWDHKVDCLDPLRHQRIALLFSSYAMSSPNHPNPCVSPWVVTMDYYGRNDITLGGFLERYCFRESYTCPSKTCDVPMSDHIRRFVHEQGSLLVVLKKLEKPMPAYEESILMWEWCRKCKEVTPVVPMSSETWSMSFAKYLELKFHGRSYNKRSTSSTCEHNIHQQHFQYFGYKDTVASFKYFPITLKEICLPPMIIDISGYDITLDQWKTQETLLSYKGRQVFSNILDQLLKCQSQLQTDAQARVITECINQVQSEKARFMSVFDELKETLSKMEECCNISSENNESITNHSEVCDSLACQVMDSIVKTKRVIAESVIRWNMKIVECLQQQKKYEKEKNKFPNVATQKEPPMDEGSDIVPKWLPKEDDLETEPTFVVKDTASVTMDTELTFSSKDEEGERAAASVGEPGSSLTGQDKSEVKQTGDVRNQGNKGSDLIGSLEPYHFASSPVSVERTWCEGSSEIAHQGSTVISSVPGSMSSASSGGSVASDKNPTFKSESTSDLDSLPKVIQGDAADDKGHQRSFSLGETKKMAKQFSLARDVPSNDQEKKSVKTLLSNLLSGSGTDPIQMPFSVEEHHIIKQCLPSTDTIPVIIYDQEPSSIISYALSSAEYEKKLQELSSQQIKEETRDSPYTRRKYADSMTSTTDGQEPSEAGFSRKSKLSFFRGSANSTRDRSPIHQGSPRVSSGKSFDVEAVKYTPSKDRDSTEDIDEPDFAFFYPSSEKPSAGGSTSGSTKSNKDQADNCHIELQFSDNTANFYCKVYFADDFRKLRKLIFPAGEERYIRSLSRCFTWLVKGGKSGSSFCKTQDDRFILKQMSRYEVHSFVKFAPHYFSYITTAQADQKPTVLAKILGVYRIGYRNSQTSSESKQDLLVMENLFYNRDITQIFDLKGSLRNRLVTTAGKRMEDLVLLDENLLKLSVDSPLYIRPHSKTVLSLAVSNDTQFLASHLIMDYSLLVGLDETRQELVLGIIDYIRTFTWDKKIEMVVKSTYSQLGGQGKMPTVIYPESYRSRFIQSMDRYFLPVPDRWAGLGHNVDC